MQEEDLLNRAALPDASTRPSRLSLFVHVLVVTALALSFVSGVLLWYGQYISIEGAFGSPPWLHKWRVLHGALNPLLCAIFGYLCARHIRYGWALRANWASGLAMEAAFLILILSSLGLYYADDGRFRDACLNVHRVLGATLPLVLTVHWIAARQWIKKI